MKKTPLRRKSKSSLAKLKDKLWELCRKRIKASHPHICFTCGTPLQDGSPNFHIGHFIASSTCSTAMRYDLDNLRPQCYSCNIWKSGNWLAFENHLIKDHGEDFVRDLKARNEATKGLQYDTLWYESRIEELSTHD